MCKLSLSFMQHYVCEIHPQWWVKFGFFSLLGTIQLCSVQSLSCVRLLATPWTAACRASLSITKSWNLLKLLSIKLVMPPNHLILCVCLVQCLDELFLAAGELVVLAVGAFGLDALVGAA